jgi:hypothetical protein
MNPIKRFALNGIVMVGMTLAMSAVGLAQQETMPDEFRGADEMAATQTVAQAKSKDKTQIASSHQQSQSRKHRQLAKHNASNRQTVVMARK